MTDALTNEERVAPRVFCEACHVCGGFTCVTVDTDGVDQLRVGLELIECLRRGDFVSYESVVVARESFGCKCNKTALDRLNNGEQR